MKVVAIIQARMGSTRLPGKIMKEVLGKPLLEYQIERVRRSRLINQIVIATTTKKSEKPIIDLCERLSVDYYQGSEIDVLSRYYEAAKKYQAEVIIRITSDCPFIDPVIVDEVINFYLKNQQKYDCVSNTIERKYPRGLDTTIFSNILLEEINTKAFLDSDREHVTKYIYNNPKTYRIANYSNEKDQSKYRWTVDTKEDFELIKNVLEILYPINQHFSTDDIIDLLEKNPELGKINEHIEQKKS